MPDINPAMDAAIHLAKLGNHAHYVAEDESRCLSGQCTPHPDAGPSLDLYVDDVLAEATRPPAAVQNLTAP